MANVEDPEAPTVFKGFLDSNGKEAVVILKDSTTLEDTVSVWLVLKIPWIICFFFGIRHQNI